MEKGSSNVVINGADRNLREREWKKEAPML
jgi:hypothetical protein